MGDGVKYDGTIKFHTNGTFTLWLKKGKWKVKSKRKFKINFGDCVEVYKFSKDFSEAICLDDEHDYPTKIVRCDDSAYK